MQRILPSVLMTFALALPVGAQSVTARDGWVVIDTDKPFATLLDDTKAAVTGNGFGVVTQAGPTAAARQRGIDIPENQVIGVFNNEFAVRILNLSVPAMIEAPVRFYLTEDEDGTATLSWKTPSFVFAPYFDEADADLKAAAGELDAAFEKIAQAASN